MASLQLGGRNRSGTIEPGHEVTCLFVMAGLRLERCCRAHRRGGNSFCLPRAYIGRYLCGDRSWSTTNSRYNALEMSISDMTGALQLPQACAREMRPNLHEQARGSTSTTHGSLSLLHVSALAPTARGCHGEACAGTATHTGRATSWRGSLNTHGDTTASSPPAPLALFHAVVPGEAIYPAKCIWSFVSLALCVCCRYARNAQRERKEAPEVASRRGRVFFIFDANAVIRGVGEDFHEI